MEKNSEYEKIPKSLSSFNLDEKAYNELSKLKWVVTEKVHGANFSFIYENNKLCFAKRKEYLKWTDDFFGFQLVVVELEERMLKLFEQLRLDIQADRYIIYGELFGGKYPHADVSPSHTIQPIQTGVYYSPSIHFCAFDIAFESDQEKTKQYLDYKNAVSYFDRFELLYAKPLYLGKWEEAINFNTRINSTIPAEFNLPALDANLIEGIVVKPWIHSDIKEIDFRPVIKIKNIEFQEEKFHEAEKWSFIPNVVSTSQELGFLIDELNQYITKNRLDSAISKIGQIDFSNKKRMADIQEEFLQDILIDFNENSNKIIDELNSSQREWVINRMKIYIIEFINKTYMIS